MLLRISVKLDLPFAHRIACSSYLPIRYLLSSL
jgi:hypothetical protein